jgi:hypothetical protein
MSFMNQKAPCKYQQPRAESTAFEAAQLIKPPARPGVSDLIHVTVGKSVARGADNSRMDELELG